MAKKILVTYNTSFEEYKKMKISIGDYVSDQKLRKVFPIAYSFDEKFFQSLRNNGAEVEFFNHDYNGDMNNSLVRLESALEASDLIFHETPKVASFQSQNQEWKKTYQLMVEELVHSKFLNKSSFSSERLNYANKIKTAEIAISSGIPMPKSWKIDEYLESDMAHLPVVLKESNSFCGDMIFFIESIDQIQKFWNPILYDQAGVGMPSKEEYNIQEYIETPSDHFTHYRIIALGDGSVLGAVLSVSAKRKDDIEIIAEEGPYGVGSSNHHCVDSPLYLGCRSIVSNKTKGASQIPFDGNGNSKPITQYDQEVLSAHGYNSDSIILNPKLRELSSEVARIFSEFGILYSGQDWLQDKQGNFYLLEINPGPGVEIFNTLYNKGEGDFNSGMEIFMRKMSEAVINYKQ